jgi:hypothetical protein
VVGGVVAVLAVTRLLVRFLAGPIEDVRAVLHDVSVYWLAVIDGKATQGYTLRTLERIDSLAARTRWPVRRHLHEVRRQVARLNRPDGETGEAVCPNRHWVSDAVLHGTAAVSATHIYLDRMERWSTPR